MFFSPRLSTCETYFRYTVKLSTQMSLIWFPLLSCWEKQPRHSDSEMLRPRYFRILTVNFHFSHLYYFTCPWIQLFICSVALETPWHPLMFCVSPSTAQSISPQTDCLKMRALTFDGWLLPPVGSSEKRETLLASNVHETMQPIVSLFLSPAPAATVSTYENQPWPAP